MNQSIIEQLSNKKLEKSLVFKIEVLQDLKKKLTDSFIMQSNELQELESSEHQLSQLKNIYTVKIREISSEIVETHKILWLLVEKL